LSVFVTVAAVMGLTALLGYLNERFLGLQQTIGLMLLALGFTVVLGLASAAESSAASRASGPSSASSRSIIRSCKACCVSCCSPAAST
jgi:hypothetical protein